MRSPHPVVAALLLACGPVSAAGPEAFHVVWDTPSANHHGSMPLGNGDLSLNAWVDPAGELHFYIGKSDSWDDNSRLLKVGKVRVRLDPAPPMSPFRQELSLADGTMHVRYGDGSTLRLWADANQPVVRVEARGPRPTTATAAIEMWRTGQLELPSIECSDVMMDRSKPNNMHGPTIVEPDTLLTGLSDRIGWFHHNVKSLGPAEHAAVQGMADFPRVDPLLHRTFGAVITTQRPQRADDQQLQSTTGTEHAFDIHVLTRHPSTPEAWRKDMDTLIATTTRTPRDQHRSAHEQWWRAFWERSWIHATRDPAHTTPPPSPVPPNNHPLRVGVDQAGQNKFAGEIRNARTPATLDGPFTLEAEIKPAHGETGRIFDKITPGGADGFLLDTHPGNGLRLICGDVQELVAGALPAGAWARVVATAAAEGWLVTVDGKPVIDTRGTGGADDAAHVSRMYALQRFITACAGRGRYPIKFNGSLFTVPAEGAPGDADYRRWGPGYWWQNTRLPYLGLCTSGDHEMFEPLLRMYVDDLLPLNKFRTRRYFGFEDAAYYIECIHFWGDVFNETYGWQPVSERKDPLQQSGYHKWEWVAGPELVWMMLDLYDHNGDEDLLRRRIIPTATAVMRFFDHYYKTDPQGRLVMHPSQALETWWVCTNPMPELAGLRAITARLLALPPDRVAADQCAYWQSFAAKLAPVPTRDVPAGKALAPAEKFDAKRNVENPELYAVFPFRLCSFEKDNRDLGIHALRHRWDKGHFGWRQDDLFMAYLGLADDARAGLVARARNSDKGSRFPAFWGPNYDWVPDQDHGGVLMKTFQAMLLQTAGDKIFLLPAWPAGWDVEFKLHAPRRTTVAATVRNGQVVRLDVTPPDRRRDIVCARPLPEGP